jgi:ferrous iron transport protein A
MPHALRQPSQPEPTPTDDPQDDTAVAPCPLSEFSHGQRVELVAVTAGRRLEDRLNAMGLALGARCRVALNPGRGPLMVELHGARVALGRGMARKILVQPVVP